MNTIHSLITKLLMKNNIFNQVVICLTIVNALFLMNAMGQSSDVKNKVIMAVFAHPDDEYSVAPVLVKYAREGAKVQLVTVTDGRYGTGQTNLKPGEELVALRKEELNCAASHMGIEKPIWMGYHDQLKLRDGFFGHVPYIQDLMRDLDSLRYQVAARYYYNMGS